MGMHGRDKSIASRAIDLNFESCCSALAQGCETLGGVKYLPGDFAANSRPDTNFEMIALGF